MKAVDIAAAAVVEVVMIWSRLHDCWPESVRIAN